MAIEMAICDPCYGAIVFASFLSCKSGCLVSNQRVGARPERANLVGRRLHEQPGYAAIAEPKVVANPSQNIVGQDGPNEDTWRIVQVVNLTCKQCVGFRRIVTNSTETMTVDDSEMGS